MPPRGNNSTQVVEQRLTPPQLGLPSPLLRRTSALQEQQTERKRREWLGPQQQLGSKVNRRFWKFQPYALCSISPGIIEGCPLPRRLFEPLPFSVEACGSVVQLRSSEHRRAPFSRSTVQGAVLLRGSDPCVRICFCSFQNSRGVLNI